MILISKSSQERAKDIFHFRSKARVTNYIWLLTTERNTIWPTCAGVALFAGQILKSKPNEIDPILQI